MAEQPTSNILFEVVKSLAQGLQQKGYEAQKGIADMLMAAQVQPQTAEVGARAYVPAQPAQPVQGTPNMGELPPQMIEAIQAQSRAKIQKDASKGLLVEPANELVEAVVEPPMFQQQFEPAEGNPVQGMAKFLLDIGSQAGGAIEPFTPEGEASPFFNIIRTIAAQKAPQVSKMLESRVAGKATERAEQRKLDKLVKTYKAKEEKEETRLLERDEDKLVQFRESFRKSAAFKANEAAREALGSANSILSKAPDSTILGPYMARRIAKASGEQKLAQYDVEPFLSFGSFGRQLERKVRKMFTGKETSFTREEYTKFLDAAKSWVSSENNRLVNAEIDFGKTFLPAENVDSAFKGFLMGSEQTPGIKILNIKKVSD